MKFNVSYRATARVRVKGTIEADNEEDARRQVADGAPLEDEDVDVDEDFALPSTDAIDLEEVKECPEDLDDEDDFEEDDEFDDEDDFIEDDEDDDEEDDFYIDDDEEDDEFDDDDDL